ncbi:unnamed protein product [Penicillium olsonii]|uniref:FAS1 domain-containing protein n=1 Tax=Penicillium olsonii TaxID=99116 RepID=A0A9W4IAZ4_PENOL|nr:unnamed protein product [Penicillium olsonii]CAG8254011.1 unnamed protein product [Penicillium olsonii]
MLHLTKGSGYIARGLSGNDLMLWLSAVCIERMRSLFLLAVTPLASALVVPGEDLVGIWSREQFIADQNEADIVPEEHWSPDNEFKECPWDTQGPKAWPGECHHRHGDWPGDERPGWGRWPGAGEHDRHGRYGEWPGEGPPRDEWPGIDYPHGWPHSDRDHPPYPDHHRHSEWPNDRDDIPCHGPRHESPHHGNPCPGPRCLKDLTIWEVIQQNEQTAHLAEMLSNDKDLISLLSKDENHTIFAPTNHALFHLELPADAVSNFLRYHIVPGRFHLHDLALHQTLPTNLTEESLGMLPQRLIIDRVHEAILNRRSMVLRADLTTRNGVIHIIDGPLYPPLETRMIIPEESIFARALAQTQLGQYLDPANRTGGTTFLPTDGAFRRLGRLANEFLFSKEGADCLRALVGYHIVVNQTLYPDVVYANGKVTELGSGHAVVDMKTVGGKEVRVDIEMGMRVNGFGRVVADLVAKDGSILMLERVLIPPKVSNKRVSKNGGESTGLECVREHEL